MSCSKYKITRQTSNGARLCCILVNPCTDLAREILRYHVTEIQFPFLLAYHKDKLCTFLNASQKMKLYQNGAVFMGLYTEFDLCLLYTFLRNLCGIVPHRNGWGISPEPSDRSLSANIDRLRIIRNLYVGHMDRMSVTDIEFENVWKELLCIVCDLEKTLCPQKTTYTEALKTLKTQTMDPQQTEHYLYLREEVADVTYRQREHDRRIADIEVEQEETNKLLKRISSCLGDEHFTAEGIYVLVSTVTVLKDRRFWKTYVRTSAVSGAIQKLIEHRVIILTGDKVGIGKSTTGKQILRELSSESSGSPRIPALVHNPEEWNKVINPKGPYIAFLDDFLGVSNFVIEAADNWKNHLDIILASAREGNVFVVVALRKHILNEARQYFTQTELFSHKFEINLSEEFKLTLEEKQNILESFEQTFKYRAAEIFGPKCKDSESNYNPDDFVILSEMEKNDIVISDPYYGFPVTCFQFFTRPECFKQGPTFFCRPTKPLLFEIKRKSQSFREQVDYCVLSYVFVNGCINSDNIDKKLFQTISSKLMISDVTDFNIADAIEDLNGSLLNKVGESTVFKFAHETILETVLVSFGKLAPDIVIKKCRKRKIHELIRTQNYQAKENEIVLQIPRKNYEDLANRMLRGDDGDGIESQAWKAAMQIVFHTSLCDTEFLAILLTRKADDRFLSILSQIWTNLPNALIHSKKESAAVLLNEMLKRFGPHHETPATNQDQHIAMPHYHITYEDIQYFLRNCLLMKHQNEVLVLIIVQYLIEQNFFQSVFEKNCSFSGRSLTFAQCCILKGWETTVEMILKLQSSTKTENSWSFTHLAAFAGRSKLLKKFVSDEMGALEMPEQRFTILQAALFGIRYGREDIHFAENNNNPFFLIDKPDFHISFPPSFDFRVILEYMYQLKNENKVKKDEISILLDEFGNNIVHYLVMHNYTDVLDVLLSFDKSIAFHRNHTEIPSTLHLAVYLGRADMVKKMWKLGIRPLNTDLSLLDTFGCGEKHSCKKMHYVCQNIGNIQKQYWSDGKNEIPDVKIRATESVSIVFGNKHDFKNVKDFLKIEDIYLRVQNTV